MISQYGESFSKAASTALFEMCGEEFISSGEPVECKGVSRGGSDLVVALPFYGTVKGHYLLVVSKESAEFLTSKVDPSLVKELKHSVLCELLNTAVGEAVLPLIQNYKDIKVFSPILSSCPIEYPEVDSVKTTLTNDQGMSIDLYTLLEYQNTTLSGENIQEAVTKVYNATELKSQYLEVMAHELKTPLNSVLGVTDLLLEENLTDEQRKMMSSLKVSSENINNIINSILEYLSLGSQDSELNESQFNLENILANLRETAISDIQGKNLSINVNLNQTVPHIVGDSVKLEKALSLLINNAVKFTEKGKIDIEVTSVMSSEDIQELEFTIKDTGVGIPEDALQMVLEPFEKVDSSITREHRGIGLGLPICQRLLEKLGGTLSIESEAGRGSRISFKLQFKLASNSKSVSPYFEGKRAVVLAHEADESLVNSLVNYGLKVDFYESLVSFFKTNKQKFDVLFLNLGIKETVQATEIFLRNKMEEKVVNIVNSDSPLKNDLMSMGAQHFLSQPFSSKDILEVSRRVLDFSEKPDSLKHIKDANLKVLVAEDDVVSQMVIKKVFNMLNCDIDVARDGLEALQKLERNNYNIVFMDLQMPKLDGLTATRKIRLKEQYNHMPIIALTASDGEKIKQQCMDCGMNGFISKPFNLDKIKKVLNLCIKYLNEKQKTGSFALID